jgi:catechol 2,3-dioxygenase-like lactoylglutathione lyase family enzyme
MPGWGVIPSIRVRDIAEALAFYTGQLEFTLDSGGEGATNSSLMRGDARLVIETAADHYGDGYNVAIRERLGTQIVHRPLHRSRGSRRFPLPTEVQRGRSDHRSHRCTALGSGGVHRRGPRR